ncbi:MAG: hypothetical protein PHW22_00330 [Bacilli bacterium]|nr:hypothetical protein [Bacilli bacterium]
MFRRGLWPLLIVLVLEVVLEFVLVQFIDNPYLIYLIVDIVVAFVFAIIYLPGDRLHFYKYQIFHQMFSIGLIIFVGGSLLLALFIH